MKISITQPSIFSTFNPFQCLKTSSDPNLFLKQIHIILEHILYHPSTTLSQAAACDGNKYQVAPNDSHLSYIL